MGVVDGTPARHLRPVAGSYNVDAASKNGGAMVTSMETQRGFVAIV